MVTAALAVLIILLKKVMDVLVILWWRPLVIRKIMEKQGIKGPAYHFLFGNMREIKEINLAAKKLETLDMLENHAGTLKRVVPFFSLWMKLYGKCKFPSDWPKSSRFQDLFPTNEITNFYLLTTNLWSAKASDKKLIVSARWWRQFSRFMIGSECSD